MLLKSNRIFWIGLVFMLITAAIPRLLTYSYSLPYVDPVDEPNYYLAGLESRGLFDGQGALFIIPQPAYIALHILVQPMLEAAGIQGLGPTSGALRPLSVLTNLVALAAIAITAFWAGGTLAGLSAGALWSVSALVIENSVYALPDPFVYMLTALALMLAAAALRDQRHALRWCLLSTVTGLLAVLMKYPAAPALFPGGVAMLLILRRDRRTGLTVLVAQAVMSIALAYWLFAVYGVSIAPRGGEVGERWSRGPLNLIDLDLTLNNLYHTVLPLTPTVWLLVIVGGLLAYLQMARQHLARTGETVILLCLSLLLTVPWLTNLYSRVEPESVRYTLPATAAACVLFGLALAYIARVLPSRFSRVLILLLLAAAIIPQLDASSALVTDRTRPDTRVALRQWADNSLDPGTVLVDIDNHKTFNPFWGGIPYTHWFDWWLTPGLMERSLDDWRTQQMAYAVIPFSQIRPMQDMDEGRTYLDSMLRLRDFNMDGYRGPAFSVYRLTRMQTEIDITLGESIRLVGYDAPEVFTPGTAAAMRFYWHAQSRPQIDYSLFVHLLNMEDPAPLAQIDVPPARDTRPTSTWDDAGEVLFSQNYAFPVPVDLPSGTYRLAVGLYDSATGVRLTAASGDSIEIGAFVIP